MKNFFFILLTLICSCKALKIEDAKTIEETIVEDFMATNKKLIKKYDYYAINKMDFDEKCLSVYRISPIINEFYVPSITSDLFDEYPTNYKICKGKTFFWRKSKDAHPSQEMLLFLDSLNFIDSTRIKLELNEIEPDSITWRMVVTAHYIENVNYIICENNPKRIKKKVKSTSGVPYSTIAKKARCRCK